MMRRLAPVLIVLRARDRSRLRRWQRRGCDAAAADDDDVRDREGGAGAGGPLGARRRTAASRSTCSGTTGSPPGPSARPAGPHSRRFGAAAADRRKRGIRVRTARRPARDRVDPPRSLIHARQRRSCARRQRVRPYRRNGKPARPRGRAERAGAHRTPTARRHRIGSSSGGSSSWVEPSSCSARSLRSSLRSRSRRAPRPMHESRLAPASHRSATTRSRLDRVGRAIGASIDVEAASPGREAEPASRPVSRVVRLPAKGGAVDDLPDRDPYPPLSQRTRHSLRTRSRLGPAASGTRSGRAASASTRRTPSFPATRSWARRRSRWSGARSGGDRRVGRGSAAAAARPHPDVAPGDGSHRHGFLVLARPRSQGRGADGLARGRDGHGHGRAERGRVALRRREWISSGGPGRPYRPGPPPADAVLHLYETRCLPGDQGRNPYVLGSCGSSGYGVEAVVAWRISYSASGPIDASGTLPTRTTATSIAVSGERGARLPRSGSVAMTGFLLGLVFAAGVALLWAGAVCGAELRARIRASERSGASERVAAQPASLRARLCSPRRCSPRCSSGRSSTFPCSRSPAAIGGAYAPLAWAGRRRERRLRERERAWPAALAQLADALEAGIAFPAAVALVAETGPAAAAGRPRALPCAAARGRARLGDRRAHGGG